MLAVGGVLRPTAGGGAAGAASDFAGGLAEWIRQAGIAIVPEGRRLLSELTVEENIRVATYALVPCAQAREGREQALELFPEIGLAAGSPRPGPCPAANSRWWCSPRPWSPSRATY